MSSSKDRKYTRIEVARPGNGGTKPESRLARSWLGVTRGVLVQLTEDGDSLVDFEGNPEEHPVRASSTVALENRDLGREAILMFEDGDARRPIILGLIQERQGVTPIAAEMDGETLEFSAKRQIILRCGEASITLTRAGKVLIRGKYVLSRSSGVNMVKGGIVHIN
jgi:Domain of unknown function (DUF6484)